MDKQELHIEYVPVDDLKPYDKNARKHGDFDVDAIAESIRKFNKPVKSDLHPTMKPVALVANAILDSTKSGDIVADFFGGSGTSIIASEQTGRICYTMEIDPHYVDVIVKRWETLTGKKAVKIA